ncbi:MAG: hypothetical protein JRI41_10420, partial [Deltaproteobacteria bacterium]|nr:hypothetical protein [Deltaproteobacteria bacterium]
MKKEIKDIGLLLDEPKIRKWFAKALVDMMEKTHVSVSLIILPKKEKFSVKNIFFNSGLAKTRLLQNFIFYIKKIIGMQSPQTNKIAIDKLDCLKKTPRLYYKPINRGACVLELPEEVID